MQNTEPTIRDVLPPIAMTAEDRDHLRRLADAALDKFPAAEFLAQEVERAALVSQGQPGLVTMGSAVEFHDDTTGETHRVTLVYPHEADLAAGRMSVLSPVGAALIGLSAGQTIAWQLPNGSAKALTVLRVG